MNQAATQHPQVIGSPLVRYLDDPRVSLVRSFHGGLDTSATRDVKRRQDCSIKICDFGLQGGSSGSHGGINFVGSHWFFFGFHWRMAATRDL